MYRNASSTLNQSRAARTLQTERQDSKICPEISVPLEITKHNLCEHIRSLLHRKTPKQLTFTNIQNREKREEGGGGGINGEIIRRILTNPLGLDFHTIASL